MQLQAFDARERFELLRDLMHERADIDGRERDRDAMGVELGVIEDVVEQGDQILARAVHALDQTQVLVAERTRAQHIDAARDRGQRRADFMPHGRQEIGLGRCLFECRVALARECLLGHVAALDLGTQAPVVDADDGDDAEQRRPQGQADRSDRRPGHTRLVNRAQPATGQRGPVGIGHLRESGAQACSEFGAIVAHREVQLAGPPRHHAADLQLPQILRVDQARGDLDVGHHRIGVTLGHRPHRHRRGVVFDDAHARRIAAQAFDQVMAAVDRERVAGQGRDAVPAAVEPRDDDRLGAVIRTDETCVGQAFVIARRRDDHIDFMCLQSRQRIGEGGFGDEARLERSAFGGDAHQVDRIALRLAVGRCGNGSKSAVERDAYFFVAGGRRLGRRGCGPGINARRQRQAQGPLTETAPMEQVCLHVVIPESVCNGKG